MNERYLQWDSSAQRQLIMIWVAQQLDISMAELEGEGSVFGDQETKGSFFNKLLPATWCPCHDCAGPQPPLHEQSAWLSWRCCCPTWTASWTSCRRVPGMGGLARGNAACIRRWH